MDIGEETRPYEFEPIEIDEPAPAEQPVPEPVVEPAEEPVREPVPA
jgi:hypothetical protein